MWFRSWRLPLLMSAAFATVLLTGCGSVKRLSADRFDVLVDVRADGSAWITEAVTFRFTGGPFSQATREIPTRFTDGIDSIGVSEGGSAFASGTRAGQFEVVRDSQVRVSWHFTPTRDSARTFMIEYRVLGLIRQEGRQDALRWGAVPPKHDYPIASSTVTVSLPSSVPGVTRTEVLGGSGLVSARDGKPVFRSDDLASNQELTVGVWFAHGALTHVPPAWQAASLRHAERARVWYLASAALAVLLAAALAWSWRRFARQVAFPSQPRYSPPDDLSPGLAGALVHNGAQWRDIIGSVMDLSRRGIVRLEERDRQAVRGRRPTEFFLVRGETRLGGAGLRPFETAILEVGFGLATAPGEVPINRLATGLTAQQSRLRGLLNDGLRELGLLDPRREHVRRWYAIAAGALALLGLVAFVFALVALRDAYGAYPLLLMVPLWLAACAALGMSLAASRLSEEGRRRATDWAAFGAYLRSIARGKVYPESLPAVEVYLPFVTVLGLERAWGRRFAKVKEPSPTWFRSLATHGRGNEGWMSAWAIAIDDTTSAGADGGAASGGAAGGGSSSAS